MEQGFITLPILSGIIYFIIRLIERKLVKKQKESIPIPIKEIFRNTIITIFSIFIAQQIMTQMTPLTTFIGTNSPVVFTNDPDF